MRRVNVVGEIIISIGVIHLFRKVDGFYGFSGYVVNSREILLISLGFIISGIVLLLVNNRKMNN